ncbi:MAG: hypothetical protein ACKPKO_46170, partial [Candidatus Fonsibacter sp.]
PYALTPNGACTQRQVRPGLTPPMHTSQIVSHIHNKKGQITKATQSCIKRPHNQLTNRRHPAPRNIDPSLDNSDYPSPPPPSCTSPTG